MKKSLIALAALCAGLAAAACWGAPPGTAGPAGASSYTLSTKDVAAKGELRVAHELAPTSAAQVKTSGDMPAIALSPDQFHRALQRYRHGTPQGASGSAAPQLLKADVNPVSTRPARYLT